jgi:hypothetical protein
MYDRDELVMWFCGRRPGGYFDITFGRAHDGSTWYYQNDMPIFPANLDRGAFDARYTSTPRVMELPGRYLMYYSARDLDDGWRAPDGSHRQDSEGVYRHIGRAELPVAEMEDPSLRFSWSVDGNVTSEQGKSLQFEGEIPGRHTVTCRVDNANGSAAYTWDVEVGGE